ncbi:hypothetical protein [Streptomyces sp. NPDC088348]|uniref:hypothetical protein n=1 Tax=Streptomyces sp. NPDC088348 TaxID=3365853 RepID=UPI003816C49D
MLDDIQPKIMNGESVTVGQYEPARRYTVCDEVRSRGRDFAVVAMAGAGLRMTRRGYRVRPAVAARSDRLSSWSFTGSKLLIG